MTVWQAFWCQHSMCQKQPVMVETVKYLTEIQKQAGCSESFWFYRSYSVLLVLLCVIFNKDLENKIA